MAANRPLRAVQPGETANTIPAAARKTTAKKAPAKKTAAKRTTATRASSATKKAAPRKRAAAPKPKPPQPIKSLVDAIDRGSYEDVLVWQRKEAVSALSSLAGPALAAMHRQISSLSKEIESIRAAKTEGTDIGEAAALPDEEFNEEAD